MSHRQRVRLGTLVGVGILAALAIATAALGDLPGIGVSSPCDSKGLTPLPVTGTGQPVVGYPKGPPLSPATSFTFTPDQIAKLKDGHYTLGIAMHVMSVGWPQLQVAGITAEAKRFGIKVLGVTNANFVTSTQDDQIATWITRKPSGLMAIAVDSNTQGPVFKKVEQAGIKLVLLDNVPKGLQPGVDYVNVTSADNYANAQFAIDQLACRIGGKGQIGIITLAEYFPSVAARVAGAEAELKKYPGIKLVQVASYTGTFSVSYADATAMLERYPNLKGIFAATGTEVGRQSRAAATATGHANLVITTNDLDSTPDIPRGLFQATGAQRPYDQGVAEVDAFAYSMLGLKVPPAVEVPSLPVTMKNALTAYQTVFHQPWKSNTPLVQACGGRCH